MTEMQYIGENILYTVGSGVYFFLFQCDLILLHSICIGLFVIFLQFVISLPLMKMSICTFTFSTILNSRHIKISFHMDLSVIAIILHVCIYYI